MAYIVCNILPYHLLSYGALLGTQLFQTFINTKVCYKALPMKEFLALQKQIFPVYFRCQLGLVVLTFATRLVSFAQHLGDGVPLLIVLGTSSLNHLVFGPRTVTAALVRRALHESRNHAEGAQETLTKANRSFARNHAMSIHLNAISVVATVWYAFSLAGRITG